jgi:hypothetical protein
MSHIPNQRAREWHRAFMEAGFNAQREWQPYPVQRFDCRCGKPARWSVSSWKGTTFYCEACLPLTR